MVQEEDGFRHNAARFRHGDYPISLLRRWIMSSKSVVLVTVVLALGLGATGWAQGDPDLIGWWRLAEGQGKTAADLSRYANHGTFVGAPKWVAGKVGGAVAFDGIDDYIRCAERVGSRPGTYPAELMPATFTTACWTKLDNFAYFSSFVGNGIDTGDDECGFFLYNWGWVDENEKDFGLAIRTETAMNYVETPNIYEKDTWYHLAATYDGTNVRIYINGVLVVGPTDVGGPLRWISATSGNYPERFAIGVWLDPGYDLWIDGTIDEVRYYSRALDAGEINALMTESGYYPFAYAPVPKHGAMIGATSQTLQWSPGDSAVAHEVYFGESLEQVRAATPGDAGVFAGRLTARLLPVGAGSGPHPDALVPGKTYYWRVDEVNDANPGSPWKGDIWSFSVQPLTAWKPSPPDGMKYVDPEPTLTWEKGMGAMFHIIYFGEDPDKVKNAAAGTSMTAEATYAPGALQLDKTYYWRVDESTGATVRNGEVWSFTTRGAGGGVKARYFKGTALAGDPVLTQTEGSIDHNWGNGEIVAGLTDEVSARWTADLEAPSSETYKLITTSDDGVRLWVDGWSVIDNWTDHGSTGDVAALDLVAGQVYSIRMEWYESAGAAVARLSWESPSLPRQIIPQGWLQLPRRATGPSPANGAPHAAQDQPLRWLAGEEATHHDIYFGADAAAVTGADTTTADIYQGRQTVDQTTFDPGPLEWGKTYYWRVDERNESNADSPWKGVVWAFTTADFLIVDDFESYNDEEDQGTRIYETWIDGVTNNTGSTVGYWDPPFAEQKIVHGGHQSMPLDYNNVNAPYYSEAERAWDTPQDWTVEGVDTLTLYVRGRSSNAAAVLYVALEDSTGKLAVVRYDDTAVTSSTWLTWQIPLSRFSPVNPARIEKLYLGVGDRDHPTPDDAGLIYIDDLRVTRSAP
jgi:hypothetical protein